jgi:uncharacterized membrane protein YfcA
MQSDGVLIVGAFLLVLFIIAFLYSSVGHGGGSGYLALFALFGIAPEFMRSTALVLNVFVAGIAFIAYYRAGFFRIRLILPFLIASIPAAYFGAMVNINPKLYKIILGVFLLIAVIRMLFVQGAVGEATRRPSFAVALLIGAGLGFFSGMIGIGGGIILSPLLILFHWATIKESAAASALFILLNSLAGIIGLQRAGFAMEPHMILWILVGLTGGVLGSYSGSMKLNTKWLKYMLAAVLLMASLKLFIY